MINIRPPHPHEHWQLIEMFKHLHQLHRQAHPELIKAEQDIDVVNILDLYLNSTDKLIFVAEKSTNQEQQTELVGMVCGQFSAIGSLISSNTLIGSIDELWIEAKCRRQGIATQLLSYMEACLFDYGVSQIHLDVWAFNQQGRAFYNKQGYHEHLFCLAKTKNAK